MIIAVDGPDGAGKTTQVAQLAEWLTDQGVACHVVSKWDVFDPALHPEARFLRGTVPDELRVCVPEMPPAARSLFVMWLHAEAAARAARLGRDSVVLLDGFWMKHAAAELAHGGDPAVVEAVVAALGPVDAVVYLDIEPGEALDRKGGAISPYECGLDPERDPSSFVVQQSAIRARLLAWAERDGWLRVEPASRDETQRRIRAVVAELLGLPAAAVAPG